MHVLCDLQSYLSLSLEMFAVQQGGLTVQRGGFGGREAVSRVGPGLCCQDEHCLAGFVNHFSLSLCLLPTVIAPLVEHLTLVWPPCLAGLFGLFSIQKLQ